MSGYQKKRTKNGRIIMAVCGVLLLLYLGGQLWGFANIKLRTEQVEETPCMILCVQRDWCSAARRSSQRQPAA